MDKLGLCEFAEVVSEGGSFLGHAFVVGSEPASGCVIRLCCIGFVEVAEGLEQLTCHLDEDNRADVHIYVLDGVGVTDFTVVICDDEVGFFDLERDVHDVLSG